MELFSYRQEGYVLLLNFLHNPHISLCVEIEMAHTGSVFTKLPALCVEMTPNTHKMKYIADNASFSSVTVSLLYFHEDPSQ